MVMSSFFTDGVFLPSALPYALCAVPDAARSQRQHLAQGVDKPLQVSLIVKEALKLLRPSIPSTITIEQMIDNTCCNILGLWSA